MERMETSRMVRVTQDGSGDYLSVQDAVDSVPLGNTCRTVIRLSPGIYRQPVYVPKRKNFITFAGISPEITVITWDNTASKIEHHQASRVIGTGTFGCGTVIVEGEDFIAENVTFENSAPEGKLWRLESLQTVVLFITVAFLAGSTALLEHCHINCKSQGFITAQSRKSCQESTGYVFLRCVITGNGESGYMYLGRPWGPFGRVVLAYTYMDACIRNDGWDNWGNAENERSACFYEYRCFGPGSCSAGRVTWSRELMDEEAGHFLHHSFVDPDQDRPWLCLRMGVKTPYSA
ncbi:hypothetical protein Bca101_063983 [Brassica carinata]